ncbi:hypothetical protein ANOM_004862 [Aspergillus nomiae NRRL 13137]|uniref:Uncharacterized protein n=1 Tax=Aspergillus nomiae NRRL (strain ATCC 15546 / NRRL 13137 / CBS 260.88 / M93) TaxID=1509407 RepID=A0A0L1J2S3_ASPN3|nr:uncharacterized protein ANOM_004862 [Aspergillus nomiae NRRL 13137]KNG86106.1 hypothetical protein ANOM_004862 [Aspergillus nomiae NRRL 13137]
MAQSYPLFALWLLLLSVVSSTAIPLRTGIFAPVKGGSVTTRADKVPLRILPLGASITWGVNSASGNGYRGPLRGKLTSSGWEVDMVGTKHHGTMKDDNVEAHSGDTIDQVKAAAQGSLKYKPNVVLINAGTNDCRRNISIPGAGEHGVRIVLADMDPETDDDNNRLSYPKDYTTNGVADDTHPNEQGYAKMANVWYKAILEASDRGFIH